MRKINKAELSVACFVFVISIVFLTQSFTYEYQDSVGPGPGYFPVWLSGILLVLSIIYILHCFRNKEVQSDEEPEKVLPQGDALKSFILCIGSMILFVVLFEYVGFVIAGTVFLYILLFKAYRWYVSLGVSLGVSLLLFYLFGTLLGVDLPGIG
ncbi:tripartite tricarboxylate transporter TctB family protein [Brevibacillus nitrificans]|uniref:tripartite tricarboxylate transporter TctB family protein n=1 Tax=Brevibacillus nitrificans TaxID=651560 RepID=UPI001605A8FC|nr:tripartite tricarboxylate transporter TctB family protein [Brevibacillus nitrificans]